MNILVSAQQALLSACVKAFHVINQTVQMGKLESLVLKEIHYTCRLGETGAGLSWGTSCHMIFSELSSTGTLLFHKIHLYLLEIVQY